VRRGRARARSSPSAGRVPRRARGARRARRRGRASSHFDGRGRSSAERRRRERRVARAEPSRVDAGGGSGRGSTRRRSGKPGGPAPGSGSTRRSCTRGSGCRRRQRPVRTARSGALVALAAAVASALAVVAAAAASCEGTTTPTVWDYETFSSLSPALDELDRRFEQAHPGVRVKRVTRDYTSFLATAKLVISGSSPPDVIEGGQGWSIDGPLVQAGLLLPLDRYASRYGWTRRFPPQLLDQDRYTSGASSFGSGRLYGVPMAVELGGWFYDRRKLRALGLRLPATLAEFEAALARAKLAHEIPIMLGNLER